LKETSRRPTRDRNYNKPKYDEYILICNQYFLMLETLQRNGIYLNLQIEQQKNKNSEKSSTFESTGKTLLQNRVRLLSISGQCFSTIKSFISSIGISVSVILRVQEALVEEIALSLQIPAFQQTVTQPSQDGRACGRQLCVAVHGDDVRR